MNITPELTPVQSSNIAAVGYDAIQNVLYIQFHSGQTYRYHGVTVETYDSLMSADSIGSYYHRVIKKEYPRREGRMNLDRFNDDAFHYYEARQELAKDESEQEDADVDQGDHQGN